jgi:hypothetical protein
MNCSICMEYMNPSQRKCYECGAMVVELCSCHEEPTVGRTQSNGNTDNVRCAITKEPCRSSCITIEGNIFR